MKENFWKRGGRRFVLIFVVLLFCGGLAFLLSELLPKYAPPDETEPTVKVLPEGKDYWITEIQGEVTLKDGVMTLKFGNHTIDISDLNWYRMVSKKGITLHHRVDVVKGNEAVCAAGFPWNEDILLSGVMTAGTRPSNRCSSGNSKCDYQVPQTIYETYMSDLDAGRWNPTELVGFELCYWVAEECRLYEVKILMKKQHFDYITRNTIGDFNLDDRVGMDQLAMDRQLFDRLTYFDLMEFAQTRNYVFEGHVHCAYDNYEHLSERAIEIFLKNHPEIIS